MLTHAEMLKKLEEARTEVYEMYTEQITKIVNGDYPEDLTSLQIPDGTVSLDLVSGLIKHLVDERCEQYRKFTTRIEQYKSLI